MDIRESFKYIGMRFEAWACGVGLYFGGLDDLGTMAVLTIF